jgi:hypothetical protein
VQIVKSLPTLRRIVFGVKQLLDPEDEGSMVLRNAGNPLLPDKVLCRRWLQSSKQFLFILCTSQPLIAEIQET